MSVVLFRVDGSAAIGTGHVMRCLAIAEAVQDAGHACRWLAARMPDSLRARLIHEGIALEVIDAVPGGEQDRSATIERLSRADALVLDNYHFDEAFRASLRPYCRRIMALDDLAQLSAFHADFIVNASDGAVHLPYAQRAQDARLLLGARYSALRREIRTTVRRLPVADSSEILLSFGGSDPLGLTAPVIAALLPRLPATVKVTALVGGSAPDPQPAIRAAAPFGAQVELVIDSAEVGRLAARAGLAISAAGSTIGELAKLGVPTLAVIIAQNQEAGAQAAADRGICVTIDGRGFGGVARIAQAAVALWQDQAHRAKLAHRACQAVDGLGAVRIAAAILESL